jgi:hypothetical protein
LAELDEHRAVTQGCTKVREERLWYFYSIHQRNSDGLLCLIKATVSGLDQSMGKEAKAVFHDFWGSGHWHFIGNSNTALYDYPGGQRVANRIGRLGAL